MNTNAKTPIGGAVAVPALCAPGAASGGNAILRYDVPGQYEFVAPKG